MPLTNSALFDRFINGGTEGHNHPARGNDNQPTMQIVELPTGDTLLVGYSHAEYARREAPTGEVTVYAGWRQWAWREFMERKPDGVGGYPTTARHIDSLIEALEPDSPADLLNPEYNISYLRPVAAPSPTEPIRKLGRYNLRSYGPDEPEEVEPVPE